MNFTDITKALQTQLNDNQDVRSFLNREVQRDTYRNRDINQTPWVAVYRGGLRYEPHTLGPNQYEAKPILHIAVQATSLLSGEDCSTKLDGYVRKVIKAIRSDRTIGGTIEMMGPIDVEYFYVESNRPEMTFQQATIKIETTVRDYEQ